MKEVEGFKSDETCKILDITRTHLGVLTYRVRNRLRGGEEAKGVKSNCDVKL